MKKTISIFLGLVLAASFLIACKSTPPDTTPQSGLPEIVRNARRNAPEDVLVGIGSARMSNQSQARITAETRARAEIARAMDTMVRSMITDFLAGSEVDPSAAMAFQESISVSLSQARLQGAIIVDEDEIDGVYYVIVHLSRSNVVNEINQAQAAARLAVPAMAAFNAQNRMDVEFNRAVQAEVTVGDR